MVTELASPNRTQSPIQAPVNGPRIFTTFDIGPQLYLTGDPIVAGGAQGSYVFERHYITPGELCSHVFDDQMLLLPTGTAPVPFRSRLNGHQINGAILPGHFRFLAAGDHLSTAWTQPLHCILVAIHPDHLQRALGEEVCGTPPELISNILPHEDSLLMHLMLAMESHLTCGRQGGKLFEQSLLNTIAAHLLTAYGSGKHGRSRNAALPHWKRKQVEDYIRANLGGDLTLEEIAQVIKLSPYHLSRSYRATTGQGLWQFVLECRVREAMRLIKAGRSPSLAHIARTCGFESYSQFIAAFRKFLGQLPSKYQSMHER